ncbi:MAG: amino acid-binding protein [Verrucomicrobia bacterium]|nr:MAG: amino acid-binding protein [Verrucomicrobiota bacterium]
MKLKTTRAEVWAATIEDRPGGLHEKLAALASGGVNIEFIVSRRAPDQPGKGVVFVTPIKGARQKKGAQAAGFARSDSLHSVRVEGADKPGLGAVVTEALADAGINLRGLSGAGFGRKVVVYLALDSAEDATRAMGVLKKLS